MNTIGTEYILLGQNKNAVVVSMTTREVVAELNLKNREMSSSLFFGGSVILVGTYVDTLFVFSYPDFNYLFSMRSHESILSMCVVSPEHQFIALGQANGHIDILKLQGSKMDLGIIVSSLNLPEAGYVNKLVVS